MGGAHQCAKVRFTFLFIYLFFFFFPAGSWVQWGPAAVTHRQYAALGAWRQVSPPGFLEDKRGNPQRPSQPATATITHQEPVGPNGEQRCCQSHNCVAASLVVSPFGFNRATFLFSLLMFKLKLIC